MNPTTELAVRGTMRHLHALGLALVLSGAVATAASAQEPDAAAAADSVAALDLPADVADTVIAAFNDPARLRVVGTMTVGAGDTLLANVAVLEGPLVLAGHVAGEVLVVNGEVRLLPGASVGGGVRVVGGRVVGLEGARVAGAIEVYPERLGYRREEGRLVRVERGGGAVGVSGAQWGRADFLIASGDSYNRVEGLPITFGPRVRTAGSNPLRLHALAIYRTESGVRVDTDDLGYYVQAEQFIGGHETFRIGATAHSIVQSIEEWQLSDLESGLGTFIFHRDFRDHFEREGVSLFAAWSSERSPYSVTGEIRNERHRSVTPGSPWSLFRNAEEWRPQPLIAEGRVTFARFSGSFDTRSDPEEPATGWYLRGHVDRGLSSGLEQPASYMLPPEDPEGEPEPLMAPGASFGRFTAGMLDIRRYNRVDPRSRLNFRLLVGGSLDGNPLPPQFQHALGGVGSLPGYDLFSLDCGARSSRVFRSPASVGGSGHAFFPRYGCDTFALLQAEYRGRFTFRMRWDSAPWADDDHPEYGFEREAAHEFAPDWTLFVDAGRGWNLDSASDEDLAVDVGAGLMLGRIGAFVALPLAGEGGLKAFIRLGPRF